MTAMFRKVEDVLENYKSAIYQRVEDYSRTFIATD